MMQMKLLMNYLIHFVQDIKEIQKHEREEVILFSIQFNRCITNVIKYILDAVVRILILQTG